MQRYHVLILVVFRGEQVGVPSLLERPPVDLIVVTRRADSPPAVVAILKLSSLVAASVHLTIAQTGETGSSSGAATLGKEVAWQEASACSSEGIAIFI